MPSGVKADHRPIRDIGPYLRGVHNNLPRFLHEAAAHEDDMIPPVHPRMPSCSITQQLFEIDVAAVA